MRGKSQTTIALEAAIKVIVAERSPITVRGVCYGLFVQGLIDGMTINNTQRVSRVMTDMRETGALDWELIVDGSRIVDRVSTWTDTSEIIRAAVQSYRRNHWQDQPNLVEVWSEKSTVAGVLAPVLDGYGVTFRVMKGFGSFTAVRQAAGDSLHVKDGQTPVVLYLGDFDPSGLFMSEIDLPERLKRYGSNWQFQRIAITAKDTEALPSFDVDTKSADARFDWYVKHHGRRAWELDAMNPIALRQRVEAEITRYLDLGTWEHAKKIEQAEVESMEAFHSTWKQIQTGSNLLLRD